MAGQTAGGICRAALETCHAGGVVCPTWTFRTMGASHSASLSNSATRLSLASPIEEGRKDNVPKADRFPLVLQRMFGGGSPASRRIRRTSCCNPTRGTAFSRCPLARATDLRKKDLMLCPTSRVRMSATGCVRPRHISPTGYFAPDRSREHGHSGGGTMTRGDETVSDAS